MAQLYSPAWASPAVAVAPSPRKVVAGIALADEGSMSFEELLGGADADMSPRSSSKRARTKKKSLWKALQRLVRHTHMPLLDGATTSLDADKWSELLGESRPSKFRGEARARHRSGPDAWDRACLRAESSFRDDVAASRRVADRGAETSRSATTARLGVTVALAKYGDDGRRFVVVDGVREPALNHGVRRTDELIAVNGKVIVECTSEEDLRELERAIESAPRPVELTFVEGEDRDGGYSPFPSPAKFNARPPRAPSIPSKRGAATAAPARPQPTALFKVNRNSSFEPLSPLAVRKPRAPAPAPAPAPRAAPRPRRLLAAVLAVAAAALGAAGLAPRAAAGAAAASEAPLPAGRVAAAALGAAGTAALASQPAAARSASRPSRPRPPRRPRSAAPGSPGGRARFVPRNVRTRHSCRGVRVAW
ncbi:FMN binding protein [Aureococcus anophagefferens]|nr:FMN binding protein [Aureococcus anophagefferens]